VNSGLHIVPFLAVEEFIIPAKKEAVDVTNTENTLWFRYKDIGCGGILFLSLYEVRLKAIYIRPESRGLGFGERLTEEMIQHARNLDVKYIEALSLKPEWFLQQGFVTLREYIDPEDNVPVTAVAKRF
jgi:N-acetylglutamate synthase-like GNAT family acetyltransferase